jgi:hypothetical protein
MAEAQRMGLSAVAPDTGPSMGESLVRGGVQGVTLGYGDEAGGGLQAVIDKVTGNGGNATLAELYRRHRDEIRAANARAREANPGTYTVGEVGGGLLVPVPGGGLVKTAAGMAALGAAGAVGYNEDPNRLGQDIVAGAAGGAGAGALGYGLGKVATSAPVTAAMDKVGIHFGRTHLAGATTPFTGGAVRNPISDEAVRAAIDAGAFQGHNIHNTSKILDAAVEVAGNADRAFVKSATEQGVQSGVGPETVNRLRLMADDLESRTLGDPRVKLYRERADQIEKLLGGTPDQANPAFADWAAKRDQLYAQQGIKGPAYPGEPPAAASARRAVDEILGPAPAEMLPGEKGLDRLPLEQAEGLKSSAQRSGKHEKLAPELQQQGERDVGDLLKQSNESAIAEQMGISDLQQYKDLKAKFSALKEAATAAEKGSAMWENRPPIGVMELVAGSTGHLPAALVIHGLKTRGYGAVSQGLISGAAKLRALARTAPQSLGKYAGVFARTATDEEAAKVHFVLNSTDAGFRALVNGLNQDGGDGGQ